MRMSGQIASAALKTGENRTTVILDTFGDHADELGTLEGKTLDIEIKVHRNRRSTRANALAWEICSQIGKAINPPIPKEDVYRKAIKDVGVFIQVCIRKRDYAAFEQQWTGRGTGWFCEIVDTHDYMDVVDVMAYCGSSTYDTKAMSTLIDYLVDEAEQMELPIAYDIREIEQIKNDWAKDLKQEG